MTVAVFRGKLASASLKLRWAHARSAALIGRIPRQACLGLIEALGSAATRPAPDARIPRQACLGLIEAMRCWRLVG